ncbi:MAG: PAS domain S-box protein [Anaerolineae bacterium]|nr:PAS domain S-box protein [Anaerolineae bacterium]
MSIKSVSSIQSNSNSAWSHPENSLQDLFQIIEVINHPVWLVDTQLQILRQNEAAKKLMGWTDREIINLPVDKVVVPVQEPFQILADLIKTAIQQEIPLSFPDGLTLPRKMGGSVLVAGKAMPVQQNNQFIGAMCTFWEIYPGKDEIYLRYEFANMASHLFRTPLSYIQASIDFLMSSELDTQERQAILSKMRAQSQRLAKYTNELLRLLRLENDDAAVCIEAVELLPLIERVLNLIQAERPRHGFTFINPNGHLIPKMAADPIKVELILLNLLLNAVRRCPKGGEIKVEITTQSASVAVSISDDGEFIPAKQLRRIFWQFYPVDDDFDKMPSTYNLGLYNTKRLVELQNGRIWAESYPGQYSQFSFSLPIWE